MIDDWWNDPRYVRVFGWAASATGRPEYPNYPRDPKERGGVVTEWDPLKKFDEEVKKLRKENAP